MIQRILLLFFLILFTLEANSQNNYQTFKNYKLAMGGGLGLSPLILFSQTPLNNLTNKLKPSLKLELIANKKVSYNLGLQFEQYKFPLYSYEFYKPFLTDGQTRHLALTCDLRRYTTYTGTLAPLGRYLMYGISLNSIKSKIYSHTTITNDNNNNQITNYFPTTKYSYSPILGIRFGIGNKRFISKKLNQFLEYQLMFDLKIGKFGKGLLFEDMPSSGNLSQNAFETGMRISQRNSIIQLNLNYGFAL
jgi:hypothetical protein